MKFDTTILARYLDEGRIMRQSHPTLPIWVYNYTIQTQYSGDWDEITLQCRGLILDANGRVIARSFPKFFNYSEVSHQNIVPWNDGVFIQNKMDGSLITLFHYNGEWLVASKGSFTSDHAIAARAKILRDYDLSLFDTNVSYIMEYISSWNRVVVDYGGVERVVFLGVSTVSSELQWEIAKDVMIKSGISENDIVSTEYFDTFSEELLIKLQSQNLENEEGYILRFSPSNYRVKVKFEEYIRLHKIMTEVSTTSVWDMLANGVSMDVVLNNVPDEFFNRIKEYEQSLIGEYNECEQAALTEFHQIISQAEYQSKSEFAKRVMGIGDENMKKSSYSAILFRLFAGKSYSDIIWKHIKPVYRKL
jgi:hypothetical protein